MKSKANKQQAPTTVGSGDWLDLTVNVTILHVQPVLSIQKLRNIANTLSKTTPSNYSRLCQELGTLLHEALTQKARCTKVGRRRVPQSLAVSSAILDCAPNADKQHQSPVEICPQMQSVLASIHRNQSQMEPSYSMHELLLGLPRNSEPLREVSRKPAVKRRYSYKRGVRSNEKS